MKASVIIVAAGSGKRFKAKQPKQFVELAGRTVLAYTVSVFDSHPLVKEIILVVAASQIKRTKDIVNRNGFRKISKIVRGGSTRSESVWQGLKSVSKNAKLVAVHDGVRPLVSSKTIEKTIKTATKYGTAVPAVIPKATVKCITKKKWVKQTLVRSQLAEIQTPQVFEYKILKDSYKGALRKFKGVTDDSSLVEMAGYKVKIVNGDYRNIKITTKEDLQHLRTANLENKMGLGYDIHPLVDKRKLVIGGVKIKANQGLYGHSDADVLLHAISDAVLGAMGKHDLGWHFPDTDRKFKDIDSSILLKQIIALCNKESYRINNLDCVVIAQKPKLQPYHSRIVARMANLLLIDKKNIAVKFCSPENIGPLGDARAIAAMAVVSVTREKTWR